MISFKEKLQKGHVYGTAITVDSPLWPSIVQSCGADFVFLDTEHIALGRKQLTEMCRIYRALGIAPVVRIPSPDPYRACQVIDDGAIGVVAPYLETVEQIRNLVGATKFRPLKGEKLQQILHSKKNLEPKLRQYLERNNAEIVTIANIESVPALERLDDLLSIPGLDAVFIGPHDLSLSLGIPEQYTNPEFEKAVRTIIEKCKTFHLAVGIHLSDALDLQIKWANEGANIVIHSADMRLFRQQLHEDLTSIRRALGEKSGRENLDVDHTI